MQRRQPPHLWNVSVPELLISTTPLFIVIVPPVGASVLELFTVKAPPTEKLAPDCDDGVPAIVSPLNVNVPELADRPPVPFMVMVPAVGARVVEPLTVSAPPTEKLVLDCDDGVSAMVNPLNVNVPELTMDQPVPVMVIVPRGEKFPLEFTVSAPAMLKLLEVVTVAEAAMVNPWNVNVPELLIDDPLFIVTVPAVGMKLPPLPTVSAVATAKLAEPTTPVPLMVRLP